MDRVWLCVMAGGMAMSGSFKAMAEGNTAAGETAPVQAADAGADFKFSPVSLGAVQEPESQPAATPELETKHDWRAAVTLWLWTPGIDGTLGARGLTLDVSASFIDVLQDSDSVLGFGGRFEAGMGKWGGYVDGEWLKVGVDDVDVLGITNIDVVNKIGILDFGLMYRLGDWPDQGPDKPHTTLDVYAGGRWWSLSLDLEPNNFPSRSESHGWVDPLVGAKLDVPIGDHLEVLLWGDVGGFGVASDFTWSATGLFGYRFELFHLPSAVYLGYRAIGDDYTNDDGALKFTWDVILHGPIMGFTVNF